MENEIIKRITEDLIDLVKENTELHLKIRNLEYEVFKLKTDLMKGKKHDE